MAIETAITKKAIIAVSAIIIAPLLVMAVWLIISAVR